MHPGCLFEELAVEEGRGWQMVSYTAQGINRHSRKTRVEEHLGYEFESRGRTRRRTETSKTKHQNPLQQRLSAGACDSQPRKTVTNTCRGRIKKKKKNPERHPNSRTYMYIDFTNFKGKSCEHAKQQDKFKTGGGGTGTDLDPDRVVNGVFLTCG